jgi:hypothetical protein
LRKSKLIPRADGPFKVLEKITENAYKLDLPINFEVSPIFNITDFKPYFREDELKLRPFNILEKINENAYSLLHRLHIWQLWQFE